MRYLLIVLLFGGLMECAERCEPAPPVRVDAGTDSGPPQWCYTPYRAHGGFVNNVCFSTFDECMRVRVETMIASSECFAQ